MNRVAGSEGARIECPHCGHEVGAGVECSVCGIVFEKYRTRHRQPREGADEPPLPPLPPPEARSALPRTLLLLLAVSIAIFAYDRLRDDSAPAAEVARVEDPPPGGAGPRSSSPGPEPAPQPSGQPPTVRRPQGPPATEPPSVRPPAVQPAPAPASKPDRARPTTYSYDWYEGADGFMRGLEEARADGRAMAVYFHTEWCGYCRQLESELLDRAKVENYLKYLTKVKINPESGRNERLIANRYGVSGYPSFFVHPGADRGATKVSGMTKRHGEWQVKTPDEFVATIRRVVGDD